VDDLLRITHAILEVAFRDRNLLLRGADIATSAFWCQSEPHTLFPKLLGPEKIKVV
jgi:hypothetical protein